MHLARQVGQREVGRLERLDKIVLSGLASSEEPHRVLLVDSNRLVDHSRKLAEIEDRGAALPGDESIFPVLRDREAELIPANTLRFDLEFGCPGQIGSRNPKVGGVGGLDWGGTDVSRDAIIDYGSVDYGSMRAVGAKTDSTQCQRNCQQEQRLLDTGHPNSSIQPCCAKRKPQPRGLSSRRPGAGKAIILV